MTNHAALVISDDHEAMLFQDLAKLQGIRISRYETPVAFAQAANDLARSDPPDLVVVDLQREKSDGLGARGSARSGLGEQVPFIALVPSTEVEAEALSAGYTRCLHSPFDLANICRVFGPIVTAEGQPCALGTVDHGIGR